MMRFISLLLAFFAMHITLLSALTMEEFLETERVNGKTHHVYLYGLKNLKDDPRKNKLTQIATQAQQHIEKLPSKDEMQRYRLKLACYAYSAGLHALGNRQANIYLKNLTQTRDFISAALKFQKYGMDDLARRSSFKAIKHMKEPENFWELYNLRTIFKKLNEHNALEKVIVKLIFQENQSFYELSKYYKELHAIGKTKSARLVAEKIGSSIKTEYPEGSLWYLHVAIEMYEQNAISDARLLMERAFHKDNLLWLYGVRKLVGHIAAAREMGFEDFAKKGQKAFLNSFSERASMPYFLMQLKMVLERDELDLVQPMCSTILSQPGNIHNFTDGIQVLELLTEHHQEDLARKLFKKVEESCEPEEAFTLVPFGSGLTFLTPMEGLVVLAHLANKHGWMNYLEESAQRIVSHTLAYPYFESSEHFIGFLDYLGEAMDRLGRKYEADKLKHYLREVQTPSLPSSLNSTYEVGQIYGSVANFSKVIL